VAVIGANRCELESAATGGIYLGMDTLESSKTEFSPHALPSGIPTKGRRIGRQRKRVASWGWLMVDG
jgi:hypothetical protein